MSDRWLFALCAAIGVCIAAALVLGVDEWRRGLLDRERRAEMWRSLGPLLLNAPFTLAIGGVWAALYATAARLAPHALPVDALTVAAAFLAVDLSYYWEHRCAHRVRALWSAYHEIHHSSPDYTIATAYRVSFLTQLFAPAFYLPWVLLGFDPISIVALQLLAFHYQAWLHTETIGPLGALDRWINTPAVHRVHHSAALEHRDRNLGAITLLWDRLFGTYAAPPREPLRYGVPGVTPPRTLLALYVEPWKRAIARGARAD